MARTKSHIVQVRHTIAGELVVLPILDSDADALHEALAADPAEDAGEADVAYLDLPIDKPWGWEEKAYEDALTEVWHLVIEPGGSTSLHAHLKKKTVLICIEGSGVLKNGDGDKTALERGTTVLIAEGARHQSSSREGMHLLEVETPSDKHDLIRFDDASGRAGTGYEGPAAALAKVVAGVEVLPLVAAAGGPPRARVRERSSDGRYGFALRNGAQLDSNPGDLRVAIAVAHRQLLSGNFSVLSRLTLDRAPRDQMFLAVTAAALTPHPETPRESS